MVFMVVMLALDLGVFHKKDHVIKIKEAAIWTGIWITLAMLFGLLLLFKAEWIHGITCMEDLLAYAKQTGIEHVIQPSMEYGAALEIYRKEVFQQYLAGYFLEESLSIDNLFIFLLGTLVERVSWVLAVFGVILIYSGIKMFRDKGDEKIDTANHPAVRFASRFFPLTPKVEGHNFFTKIDGRTYMTPLFLVLLVIEFSDIIFAVDSIPAVFSVTTDPFIVYFSNIFAIMGLRSLFFLLSDITDKFWLLKYGLGALLCFIGIKMIGHEFFGLSISTMASLMVILGILVFSILFSLIIPKKTNKVSVE